MNKNYEIYRAVSGEIPNEDAARLDGYLAAKAEETEKKQAAAAYSGLLARFEIIEAQLRNAREKGG